jgi:hypothetical protein
MVGDLSGGTMSGLEAILLGAMLAYTPSIVVLAASLWNVPELDEEPRIPSQSPAESSTIGYSG